MNKQLQALIAAIVADNVSTVRELIAADASAATHPIRTPTLHRSGIFHWIYAGDTALHLAAAGYRLEIVQRLLAAGADPNAAGNRRRSTPLHYAADGFITGPAWNEKQQVATIRCLILHNATLNLPDMNGATPLHRAVRTRSAAAVKYLLQAGADPGIENKSGSTPFHLAVQNTGRGGSGEPEAVEAQRVIIETFLAAGLNPTHKNSRGKSVADCARSEWIRELLDF